MNSNSNIIKGRVLKIEANFYSVAWDRKVTLCSLRANLRKAGQVIKVGDEVRLENTHLDRPVIVAFENRRNELDRPAIANVDQVLLVMSCLQPDFNTNLMDRLILAVKWAKLTPVVCISKSDLITKELKSWLSTEYAAFPLYFFSSLSGQGLNEIRSMLMNKVSVLAGPSGAGKSSLINSLNPNCRLTTCEVNQKLGTGKHITRHVSMHPIYWQEQTGWIADSPGFNTCTLPPLEPAQLASFYPEFSPWLGKCAFSNCLHRKEQNCAVKTFVNTHSERYYNYLRLLEEVETCYKQRQTTPKMEELTKNAIGKNIKNQVLKLGTAGRARSRRTQKQALEQINHWVELDPEAMEDLGSDEWRI